MLDTAFAHEPRKLRTRPVAQATDVSHIALNFPVIARSPHKQRGSVIPPPTHHKPSTSRLPIHLPPVAPAKVKPHVKRQRQQEQVPFEQHPIVRCLALVMLQQCLNGYFQTAAAKDPPSQTPSNQQPMVCIYSIVSHINNICLQITVARTSTSGQDLPLTYLPNTASQPTGSQSSSRPVWLTIILENSLKFENANKFMPEFTRIHHSLEGALLETGPEDIQKTLHTLSKNNVGSFIGIIFGITLLTNGD